MLLALVPALLILWLLGAWLRGDHRQGRWAAGTYVFLAGLGVTAGVLVPALVVVKNAEPLALWAKALVAVAAALGAGTMLCGLGVFNRRRRARPLAIACLLLLALAQGSQSLRAGSLHPALLLYALLSVGLPALVAVYLSRPGTAAHFDA